MKNSKNVFLCTVLWVKKSYQLSIQKPSSLGLTIHTLFSLLLFSFSACSPSRADQTESLTEYRFIQNKNYTISLFGM